MPPIGQKASHNVNDRNGALAAGGIVFPRLLRKPVRQVRRFVLEGGMFSTRSLAVLAAIAMTVAAAPTFSNSQAVNGIIDRAALAAGIRIGDIKISGVREVSRIDVLSRLDLGPDKSLFSFDVHKAREDLKAISWIHDVTVTKSYPDTLVVSVVERTPFAIWQRGDDLRIISRDGNEIAGFEDRFAGLPLVVGPGANDAAADIMALTSRYRDVANRIKAFVRVGSRRWDLILADGVRIMLPAQNAEAALIELVTLDRDFGVTERAVSRIDLRLADRVVVGLSEDGEAQHQELVKARKDSAKAREKGA